MASTHLLKKNYRCDRSLQQFYTGGPFAVGLAPSGDGEGGAEAEAFLACACGGEVRVVSAADASAIGEPVDGDLEAITALALSPDSRLIFAAGHSRLIRVWDLSSRTCICSWKGHDGPIMAMACHASGGLLATAGADKKVCVWDVDGGFCTHFLRGHTGVVTTIMFHKDPKRLLLFSGSEDGTVRVWNLETKECAAVLKEHFSAVTSLALSDDGQTLLSAGRDKIVTAWDIRKYSPKKTIPTYEMIEAVSFIGSGSELLACLGIGLPNMKEKAAGYLLTVGERGVVRIWCLESCLCVFEQQTSDVTVKSENEETRGFTSAVMLPNDQGLLCVTADQQFLFYCPKRTDDGTFELSLYRRLIGYNDEILDLKFVGEEEQYLAVATNLEQVRVYDVASMSCSYLLAGHTEIVVCIDTCVSASGKTLVVTGSKDNTVRVWDAERRSCIGIGKGHLGAVGSVAFLKKTNNSFVSGSSDRTIKVWTWDDTLSDAEDVVPLKAKAVVAAHDKDINSLAISPNDDLVCSGSEDRTACIWKLPNLVSSVALKGHKRGIWSVEFSPVEPCVMTSSGDRTIKIWSVADGSCLKTFEGHTSSVLRASFLSRGTQVVSCGSDGLVKLWTIETNECIATYDKHDGKVCALAVGMKTEMVATGGADAVLNLWHDCTMEDKQEDFLKKDSLIEPHENVMKKKTISTVRIRTPVRLSRHCRQANCSPSPLAYRKKTIKWNKYNTKLLYECCVEEMKSSEKLSYKVIAQKLRGKGLPCNEKNVEEKIRSAKKLYTFWKEKVEPYGNMANKLWDKILKKRKSTPAYRNLKDSPPENLEFLEIMFGPRAGQNVPHVPPLMQSGHQPVSAPTTLPSRADASTEWKEFTTPEGRKCYFNEVTKQSKWAIPDELKVARELAEKASNQQPDREPGIAASALVGSAASEPSTVPANQSSSAVGIIAQSSHDGSSNSVPPGAAPSHNVENTSRSIVHMQNCGPSTAVVPVATSTEVPLVATDAGASRNNNENSSLTTGANTEDGISAEDLEEAKKTMPVAGKINVTPLEEKTSEEEPAVYATKMEAKNAFKSLLKSVNVESDSTWDQTMRGVINDKRYGALKTLGERKQAFNEVPDPPKPRDEAAPSHNVENTSSSIVHMQNCGPSTAVVPVATSTEVPLVATDARASRNNNENSSLTTGADTQDGTSTEDLEVPNPPKSRDEAVTGDRAKSSHEDRPIKRWTGKGIPNSTNKYKEDQKVSWHATPFEERLEKAVSKEKLLSEREYKKQNARD